MDFATIGTLSSYVKQKNLTFAAKHKIRTGQTLTNANGNFISMNTTTFDKLREAAKTSTDQAKQQKLARIRQKLKAGQKLTDEELGFLRVNDPKTYKKAKSVDEAREELKDELKKAKSKGEAREAMTRAMIKASTEAMAELGALGQGGGEIQLGISNEELGINSGMENQSPVEVNQAFQNSGDNSADIENNPLETKNSDENTKTPEDIMEKYIWKIRALEDEWARFTGSKKYRDLPETVLKVTDKKIISEPDHRILRAARAYRRAMA